MEQIGPYTIQGELARGGQGVVYRATDTRLKRPVVLKLLAVDSEDQKRRLLREARAMAQLRHPHVVSILGAGGHEGCHGPRCARERVGCSLRSLQKRMKLARGVDAMPEVATALKNGDVGFESASMILRRTKPRFAAAWVDRAKVRTVVGLRGSTVPEPPG